MGYLHIDNLYKAEAQTILLFRECYALEKVHGTSAHVRWDGARVHLFPGGEKIDTFSAIFGSDLPCSPSLELLAARFLEKFGDQVVTVFGEAYGGKCQGMRATYGDRLRFVAFDVRVGDAWLNVAVAVDVVTVLGLEFVAYRKIGTDLTSIDIERDRPSEQAKRNGIGGDRPTEGVVLRPLVELTDNAGRRVIAKHKREEFRERKTIPDVDPSKREMLERADAIAEEWVTDMRLTHVLDKLGNPTEMSATGSVIAAMVEDVCREASGEIVESKAAKKAIGALAAKLYKRRISKLSEVAS